MSDNEYMEKILLFVNSNPVAHLATLEGDQPRVRGMLMWFADESGFYFHTGSLKKLASQIQNGAKAEIAFLSTGENPGESVAVRASGKVEILEDSSLKERLFQQRPWVVGLRDAHPDAHIIIFRVCGGEAYMWDMSRNMRESSIPRVAI